MEKHTRQRNAIREVIEKEGRPLTAAEIYRMARKIIPRLGMATVYRALRRMQDEQRLVGMDFPGQPTRYELPTQTAHSHFICSICGKVFDLPDVPEIPPVEAPKGFQAKGYEFVIFGSCAECTGGAGNGRQALNDPRPVSD